MASLVFSAGAAGGPASLWLREAQIDGGAPASGNRARHVSGVVARRQVDCLHGRQAIEAARSAGGPVVTLADVPRADPNQPGAWSRDGVIVFGCSCGLERVSASGGAVTTIRKVDGGVKETAYGAPQFLPDGNRFIYFVASTDPKVQGVFATSLTNPAERTLILNTGAKAVHVAPRNHRPGYLLWMEGQTLRARPFDADSLQWKGDPISLAEGVATTPRRAAFWISGNGLLLYARGPALDPKLPLVWFGTDGKPLGDAAPEGPYNAISISPTSSAWPSPVTGFREPTTPTAISGSGTSHAIRTPASPSGRQRMRIRCRLRWKTDRVLVGSRRRVVQPLSKRRFGCGR